MTFAISPPSIALLFIANPIATRAHSPRHPLPHICSVCAKTLVSNARTVVQLARMPIHTDIMVHGAQPSSFQLLFPSISTLFHPSPCPVSYPSHTSPSFLPCPSSVTISLVAYVLHQHVCRNCPSGCIKRTGRHVRGLKRDVVDILDG
ncbi:hypothetical protein BDN70DRAFT_344117 [Pholiota conissans]|uniref:Uncharacterized protein n=1 Tax=Pholiota conissans TaxID=109636 RepID=A0A9P5YUK7_9AGAR|nr:hypothetical protein BDN70DRAFT_344117 [Pholiota conissans]